MPTDKKGNCLILNFCKMNNEQEMLELFKVEELEKRYEMRSWRLPGLPDVINDYLEETY